MPKKLYLILNFFVLFLFLLLRLPGLGKDISNSDAARWHRRTNNFMRALKNGDFRSTYQHYQPGVTLMWISGFASITTRNMELENTDDYQIVDRNARAAVVLVLASLLLLQMSLISKVWSSKAALIFGFLISLEPYMVGIDRWFHVTSLETYLAFVAFLSIIVWSKTLRSKYLIISAACLAFAVLSKLTAIVILPILLYVIYKNKNSEFLKHAFLLLMTFAFVFILLFPAMWVAPVYVVSKLFDGVGNAVISDIRSTQLLGLVSVFFYPLILLYKLSPITLVLLIISLMKVGQKHRILFFYIIYFLLILSLAQKKIDRYILEFIPPILLLVSLFLSEIRFSRLFVIGSFVSVFTGYIIYTYFPIYSAYYSPFFGGTGGALNIGVYDNSGEYFSQAAFYLNGKGRDKFTYVPYNIESFSYYYSGKVQREINQDTNYIVISKDLTRRDPLKLINCRDIEKSFGPRGFPVVFVCRTSTDPVQS